jgi:Uma2 family endonuclease
MPNSAKNCSCRLRLRDIPLLNRRPDVVLYRCLDAGERLRPEHVQLVIEIVSPGSQTTDEVDKPGEYAKAGIPHYWIVRLDAAGVSMVERYQLDRATSTYKHVGTLMKDEPGSALVLGNPIPITIDWDELEY